MKILMLNHNLIERGSYFRCYHFARCLAKRNHDVTLITTARSFSFCAKRYFQSDVEIIQPPRWISSKFSSHDGGYSPLDIFYRIIFVFLQQKNKYDIVHGFEHRPNVLLPWYLVKHKHTKNEIIFFADWADWWCRGGIITEKRKKLKMLDFLEAYFEEKIKKDADYVTCASTLLKERAVRLGLPAEKVFYLPSGADIETFNPNKQSQKEARTALNIPLDAKIIEFVGYTQWDFMFLLESFKTIENKRKDVYLLVVGPSPKNQLRRSRVSHDLSDSLLNKIIAPGIVEYQKLPIYLACADLLLLPMKDNLANQARWPNKIGDYLASGKPIVATAVGEIKQLFTQYKVGLLSEVDPSDFADKILYLLAHPEIAAEFGKEARRVAEEHYSWEILTSVLEKYYLSATAKIKIKEKTALEH